MARPIWTGSLSFGLVNVPVGIYSATQDHSVHFHQFEEGTADRIRYLRVNERTGKEVPLDRIVRGVDVDGGEFVIITDDELDAIAPERSQSIEIEDFVGLDEIDPIHYQTTYYLAPRGSGADRAYALLRAAMDKTRKVGIASFVMRGKEHLVAVRPDGEVLALETMFYADEIRDPRRELPDLPKREQLKERELKAAEMLIDSLSTKWQPGRYRSTYRQEIHELVDRKRKGETISRPPEPRRPEKVVDLTEALEASLRRAQEGKKGRAGPGDSDRQDLSAMTKSELAARAAELHVEGRSKMNRRELEAAVRSRSEATRRAS